MSLELRRPGWIIQILFLVTIHVHVLLASTTADLKSINDSTISPDTTTKSSSSKRNTADGSIIFKNEETSLTTPDTELSTTEITPDSCADSQSGNLIVTDRTSDAFNASISYNCSFTHDYNFTIKYNQTAAKCNIHGKASNLTGNITIEIGCSSIWNKAGRTWSFQLNRQSLTTGNATSKAFNVTLRPLSLDDVNITIINDTSPTSALIHVWNCSQIAELEYLVVRCNDSDQSRTPIADNCTHICSNLQPGCRYNASLIRLSIPISDNNDNFIEINRSLPFAKELGQTKIVTHDYSLSEESITIGFQPPDGCWDKILIHCSPQNGTCPNYNHTVNASVDNPHTNNFTRISPIVHGVNYSCQAITTRKGFEDVQSEMYEFGIELDQPTNLHSNHSRNNESLTIFFERPRGCWDEVFIDCSSEGHICPNKIHTLNATVPYSPVDLSTEVSPVIFGVTYLCRAITKQKGLEDAQPVTFNVSTELDQPTDLTYNDELATIDFPSPRGCWEEVFVECSSETRNCTNDINTLNATVNYCSTSCSARLASVVRGVNYSCQAMTKQKGFKDISSKMYSFQSELGQPTNFVYNDLHSGESVTINFQPPRGCWDEVFIDCSSKDRTCLNNSETLSTTANYCGVNCSARIFPIIHGVNYSCQAVTKQKGFSDALPVIENFHTDLESILYNGTLSSNQSFLTFSVYPKSDYQTIASTCTVIDSQSKICVNLTKTMEACSTSIQMSGTRGCDYNCSFTTEKANYMSITSDDFTYSILPPKPMNINCKEGSRWILLNWEIEEITNIKSFTIISNDTEEIWNETIFITNDTTFSHNYTLGIKPYRSYVLAVQLTSNYNTSSESITVKTSEEAPPKPTLDDSISKITPKNDDERSTHESFVLIIDPSLFSSEYGPLLKYLIYVRQDLTQNTSEITYNGTYTEALSNSSIDYLAMELPVTSFAKDAGNNIIVLLGNETSCSDSAEPNSACNGRLKPSTSYQVIVSGCTSVGCTNALSKIFVTNRPPPGPPTPPYWLFVFLPLALVGVGLVTWKRKPLKRFIDRKIRSQRTPLNRSPSSSFVLSSIYTIPTKRPKPLHKYLNLTNDDEKAIFTEYQELESSAPQYRQSDYDGEYTIYNRYSNIPSRGVWDKTAVRLNGTHRIHDYINANEIRGLDNDKQYIACQGPLTDTCQDFWDMILQYKVTKIVMLTRTDERNPHNPSKMLSKCYRYFPGHKGETLTFNGITVQVLEVDNQGHADLEIRHLLVRHENTEHRVYHYYFTGWPDFSVVDRRKLLDLIETINQHGRVLISKDRQSQMPPIVVHCSAGVGRTGTYIAVDIITRLIKQSEQKLSTMILDVMGIVFKLREDRVKMVQTKDQYLLVNRCVEEYLKKINRIADVMSHVDMYENPDSTSDIYLNAKPVMTTNRIKSSNQYVDIKANGSPAGSDGVGRSSIAIRQSKKEAKYKKDYDELTSNGKAPSVPTCDSSSMDDSHY